MAHFVPNPPDKEYWVPKLRVLSLYDKNGTANINVWGLGGPRTDDHYSAFVLANARVDSQIVPSTHTSLTKFYLRGLKGGDKVAVYVNANFGKLDSSGKPLAQNWVQFTDQLEAKYVAGDRWAADRAAGRLPRSKFNNQIQFDPLGAQQRHPPLDEIAWLQSVENTISKICQNNLGRGVVAMIRAPLAIKPWIPTHKRNANSDIIFSPQTWSGTAPGSKPDEVLFHELIHVIEERNGGGSNYKNIALDFEFDETDFLSVNATNVYSCMLGRKLRKDHHSDVLPQIYFKNPETHFSDFADNYRIAKLESPALYNLLKASSKLWNPFQF